LKHDFVLFWQLLFPRMSPENLEKNKVLLERLKTLADKKNCSLNQLALAWVIHKGRDVVAIPGTTKKANLDSNIGAFSVHLSEEEIAEIEAAVPIDEVAGERYPAAHMPSTFAYSSSPPLSSWKDSEI
jgi:aryl-alcohol dehydrogenase-like predicted oxidoreductase